MTMREGMRKAAIQALNQRRRDRGKLIHSPKYRIFSLFQQLYSQSHILIPFVRLLRKTRRSLTALLIYRVYMHAFVVHIFLLLELEESHQILLLLKKSNHSFLIYNKK